MNLLGQNVVHKKYGTGVITDLFTNKVTVCFSECEKLFLFPNAFPEYLTLEDPSIQKEIDLLNKKRLSALAQIKKEKEKESRYLYCIYKSKLSSNSQIAYNLVEKDATALNYVETGCILSGDKKGQHRTPSKIQPNSAILLTDCNGSNEDQRIIWGLAMVDRHFFGDECHDGQILLHKEHTLILPKEHRISFWSYFKREDFPSRWSSIPFKYFKNQTMHDIIWDVCNSLAGSELEQSSLALYRYFCSTNRMAEKSTRIDE